MADSKQENIFSLPNTFNGIPEIFEKLHESEKIKIEKIVTNGAISSPGEWYDQDQDEWVLLLQGTASLEFKNGIIKELESGEYIFIPAHKKHRVLKTSAHLNCIWLTIHEK